MSIANLGQILAMQKQIGGNAVETAVAKAYLQAHAADFDRVDLNVGLGPGITLPAGTPDYVQTAATYSSKPRADMILWRGDVPTIVEVKDRAYSAVIGQLITYWHFMKSDNPKLLNIYKTVAARTVQDGIQTVMEHNGITIELYPYASPPASS